MKIGIGDMTEKAKRDDISTSKEGGALNGCRKNIILVLAFIMIFVFGIFLMRFGVLDALLGTNGPPIINLTSVLDRIQYVSDLTTVRYSYSNVIVSERDLPPLLAGLYRDKLMLVAVGYVTAGIDLSKLTQDDVSQDGNVIHITLPAPELFDCFFSEPESYVASRETGFFAAPSPDLDMQARRYAIRIFRDSALEKGILSDASGQAEKVMSNLLGAFYPDATIVVSVHDLGDELVQPTTCGG